MTRMQIADQAFRDPAEREAESWRVILNGRLLSANWNSKGAAEAGLQVERRRAELRQGDRP